MIDFLPYILKSTIALMIFFGCYKLFFEKETSLVFNRFYLLGALLFSLIVPLLTIYVNTGISDSTETLAYVTTMTDASEIVVAQEASKVNWLGYLQSIGIYLYLFVAGIFLIRMLINLGEIGRNVLTGVRVNKNGSTIILSYKEIPPHTFFKYIFLYQYDFRNDQVNEQIIHHEKAHADQLHTIDILILELAKVIFWWHPMIYLYKNNIQLNHEYLADQAVLKSSNIVEYQQAILNSVEQCASLSLVSNFNFKQIKKRFIMMTKTKNASPWKKLMLLLPILIGTFLITVNIQAQETKKDKEEVKKEVKVVKEVATEATEATKATKATKEIKEMKEKQVVMDIKHATGTPPSGEEKEIEIRIKITDDGEEVIEKIVVNGKELDKSEYGEYKDMIKKHEHDVEKYEKDLELHEKHMEKHEHEMKRYEREIEIHEKDLEGLEDEIEKRVRVIERQIEDENGNIQIEIRELLEGVEELEKDLKIKILKNLEGLEKEIEVIILNELDGELEEAMEELHNIEIELVDDFEKQIQLTIEIDDEDDGKKKKKKKNK